MDATPARHTQGPGMPMPGLPIPKFDPKSFSGRGEAHKMGHSFSHVVSSSGTCLFLYWALPSVFAFLDFMRAVSGWDLTIEELIKTGERVLNIRHAFNIREGLNPLKFKVPDRIIGNPPPKEGPLKGVTVDEETMDREYLTALDWDLETAKPSKKKLQELGLEDVAKEILP
jgi:aldehyde:ferredoxin oxidoreductase